MAEINKEIGLEDILRGIGMGGNSSDDEKLNGSGSGKSGHANEIEIVGKEL